MKGHECVILAAGLTMTLGQASVYGADSGSTFTYQGRLKDGATPADGPYDFEFSLWDAVGSGDPPTGGDQIGMTLVFDGIPPNPPPVTVTNGLFTVQLNENGGFGPDAFNGEGRWLQIAVSPAGAPPRTVLSPRQPITATPQALYTRGTIPVANVRDFGATGDGTTDDTTAIQSALLAGDVVHLPPGTYLISSTLTLRSAQRMMGAGWNRTHIRLAAGADCDMLKTEGFDSLTLQNRWLVDDGVPYDFGVEGIRFDGNRDSNTAGDGLKIYGKRYTLRDVYVMNVHGVGIYSECGTGSGPSDWRNSGEALFDNVKIWHTGGHGLRFRGPHDSLISSVLAAGSGLDGDPNDPDYEGDGVVFESLPDVYSGAADVRFIHSYSNHGAGVRFEAACRCEFIIGESCWKEGIVVDCLGGTFGCLYAFYNDRLDTSTYYNVRISGTVNQVERLRVIDYTASAGGLLVEGGHNRIESAFVTCQSGSGALVGASLETYGTVFRGQIHGYQDPNACGLKTNTLGWAMQDITAKIVHCRTGWQNTSAGTRNRFSINVFNDDPSYLLYSGSAFGDDEVVEFWGKNPEGTKLSKQRGEATISENTSFVDVPHDLMLTPGLADIVVSSTSNLAGASYWISDITATTFRISISRPLDSDATFAWRAELGA